MLYTLYAFVAEMAQQAHRMLMFPLIDPLTYWDLCRALEDHDTTILRWVHLWSTKTPVGKAQEEVKVTKTCGVVIGLERRVFSLSF